MPKIHILDKAVAELIAAGEVVERPASIVKELVENAVDAGATAITVEIKGGGIGYIRVADNGCGIDGDDIPKAFLRHATSKVRQAEDLDSIATLGFRGEALASIAAMCRVELTTKTADATEGTLYRVEGGEFAGTEPAGCPEGTSIVVRDVFFNTPARMKFLKKDISEGNAVAQVVDKCALSHPEISFRFIRDGQVRLRTSGNGDLLGVILAIYSRDFAGEMLAVDYHMADTGIRVSGYVSKPSGAKPSRTYQNFFINSRYVRSRTCSAAVEEACKTKLMAGKFPACVLSLELAPEQVDVNVHPAKIEVRFLNEKPIFNAVYFGVKSALSQLEVPLTAVPSPKQPAVTPLTLHTPQPEYTQERITAQEFRQLFDPAREGNPTQREEPGGFTKPLRLNTSQLDIYVDEPAGSNRKAPQGSAIIFKEPATKPAQTDTTIVNVAKSDTPPPPQRQDYRLVGELFGTYILLEGEEGLLLVDKHAAHERLLYERLKENLSQGNRQVLLSPMTVHLSREEYGALLEDMDKARELGFLLEDFGDGALLVREVPIELGERDVAFLLAEIAHRLAGHHRDLTPHVMDRLYYSIACKSAIRAGDKNSPEELREIIRKLEENPQVTHCPHGRPVSVQLTKGQIEKMFGRLG